MMRSTPYPTTVDPAEHYLEQAQAAVRGRAVIHGDARDVFERIADLWSAYLGDPITPAEAAQMMVLLKIARAGHGTLNPDDFVDMAGYAAIAAHIAESEVKEKTS